MACLQVSLMLVLLTVISSMAKGDDDSRDPRQYFFIQSFNDMPDELVTAREQGKKGILFFFEAEGCRYCQAMLKDVLSRKEVQDWYEKHFLSIAVDIHGDVEITDFDGITLPSKVFASHRKVLVTPVLSFIDLQGSEIYRHTGMVKSPEEFLLMGEYVAGGHNFDKEFGMFLEQKGFKNTVDRFVTPVDRN